jgi:hypothetical protein
MECRLAGETEVLREKLPQHHFCPSQNPTWPDLGLNPGRHGRKPATNRLSYGAALWKSWWDKKIYLDVSLDISVLFWYFVGQWSNNDCLKSTINIPRLCNKHRNVSKQNLSLSGQFLHSLMLTKHFRQTQA